MPLPLAVQRDRDFPTLDWYSAEERSPAVMHDAIREFKVKKGATVLDLFCASGTSLVASRLLGCDALGFEEKPFLHLAASTKTRADFDLHALELELEGLIEAAELLLAGDKGHYPASEAPQIVGVERWLSGRVADKVMALKALIKERVTPANQGVPMLALASILQGVSNLKLSPHAFG